MDVPVEAPVYCTDGSCGHSTHVVLKTDTNEVTHLVVVENHGSRAKRLVSINLVKEASADAIQLGCTLKELDALAPFIQTELVLRDLPARAVQQEVAYYTAGLSAPPSRPRPEWVRVKHEAIRADEVAVRRGAQVVATDGPVGRVDEFVVDGDSERVTHLVMRTGHLWGKKEVCIPVSAIDRIWEDTVYLTLEKAAVAGLPEVALPGHHRL